MQRYGLFQGLTNGVRKQIANEFISFSKSNSNFIEEEIGEKFKELHERFKRVKTRKWISATSKLLWCLEPNKIVMYDAFVERAILVLQCFDEDLAKLKRIGTPPEAKKDPDSTLMKAHYMNYQNLVKTIYNKHLILLKDLKTARNVNYEYDIRIIDKVLWMMGNYKKDFVLGDVVCRI